MRFGVRRSWRVSFVGELGAKYLSDSVGSTAISSSAMAGRAGGGCPQVGRRDSRVTQGRQGGQRFFASPQHIIQSHTMASRTSSILRPSALLHATPLRSRSIPSAAAAKAVSLQQSRAASGGMHYNEPTGYFLGDKVGPLPHTPNAHIAVVMLY